MQLCVYVKLSILLNAQLNKAFKAFRFSSGQSINVLQMGKKMFAWGQGTSYQQDWKELESLTSCLTAGAQFESHLHI